MDIIYAYVEAAQTYVGTTTAAWDSEGHVFLWLLFNAEMLLLGPQQDKAETINACVARCINMFRCGHIEALWAETRAVMSRPSTAAEEYNCVL